MKPDEDEEWVQFNPLAGTKHAELLQRLAAATDVFFSDDYDDDDEAPPVKSRTSSDIQEASTITETVAPLKIKKKPEKITASEQKSKNINNVESKKKYRGSQGTPSEPPAKTGTPKKLSVETNAASPRRGDDLERKTPLLMAPLPPLLPSLSTLLSEFSAAAVAARTRPTSVTVCQGQNTLWSSVLPPDHHPTHLRFTAGSQDTHGTLLVVVSCIPADQQHLKSDSPSFLFVFDATSGQPWVSAAPLSGGPVAVLETSDTAIALYTVLGTLHCLEVATTPRDDGPRLYSSNPNVSLATSKPVTLVELVLLPKAEGPARIVLYFSSGVVYGVHQGIWERLDTLEFLESDYLDIPFLSKTVSSVLQYNALKNLQNRSQWIRGNSALQGTSRPSQVMAEILMQLLEASQYVNGTTLSESTPPNGRQTVNAETPLHGNNHHNLSLDYLTHQVRCAAFMLSANELTSWLNELCRLAADLQCVELLSVLFSSVITALREQRIVNIFSKASSMTQKKASPVKTAERSTWGQYEPPLSGSCYALSCDTLMDAVLPKRQRERFLGCALGRWASDLRRMGLDANDILANVMAKTVFPSRWKELWPYLHELDHSQPNDVTMTSSEVRTVESETLDSLFEDILLKLARLNEEISQLEKEWHSRWLPSVAVCLCSRPHYLLLCNFR